MLPKRQGGFSKLVQPAGTLAARENAMTPLQRRIASLAWAAALIFHVPMARAEDASIPRLTTVVTATRVPQSVSSLLSDVRVITSDDIAQAGNLSLPELLRARGGVEIATNGGPGQVAAMFLRGTNPNHVVVLIDGVRINSATSGTPGIEVIPLTEIDHIEILRGPASSLYGADAIGGVVQIFTKSGGDRVVATGGYGTWNTQRYAADGARTWGATHIAVQAGYESSDGFSATNPANTFSFNPDRDPYRNRNAGVTLAHGWSLGHEITLRTLLTEDVAHFDAGPGTDDINRHRIETYAFESRDQFAAKWQSVLRVARATDDSNITGGFPSTFRTHQDQLTWQNDISLPGGSLAAGVEARREHVDSTSTFSTTSRSIESLFASYAGAFDRHLLQASARYDHNSQFGSEGTGNLAYGFRVTPSLRLTGSFGNAFKAPTFNDLYFQSPFFSGNPALSPERSKNVEGGAYYEDGGQRASLVLYQNRIHDLIAVDPTFTTVINVNQARIRGANLQYARNILGCDLRVDATFEDPVDVATGNRLPRRAREYGTLAVDKALGRWRFGGELIAQGERFDSVGNTASSRMGGYVLVDLRAAYAVSPAVTVALRWNNVLDKRYELAQGYNTPRSNGFLSVEYAMR